MKIKDFDFRLVLTPEVMTDIACDNKDCPQMPHFIKIVKTSDEQRNTNN